MGWEDDGSVLALGAVAVLAGISMVGARRGSSDRYNASLHGTFFGNATIPVQADSQEQARRRALAYANDLGLEGWPSNEDLRDRPGWVEGTDPFDLTFGTPELAEYQVNAIERL